MRSLFRRAENQSAAAWPACCEASHSRIASASCSAWAEVLTRNVMLSLDVAEELLGGADASCLHIVETVLDTLNGFFEVLAFPLQVGSQSFIERIGWTLPTLASEFFQLGLALWLEGYRFHDSS